MDTLTLARDFASLLLDSAAKGTALLLLAEAAVWLCRRSSAALRHSIWCMTMGGLLLLPIASWALPAWQIPILPPESIPASAPIAEFERLPASSPVVETATLPPFEHAPQFATEQPEMPSEQRLIEPVVITSPVIEPATIPAPAHRESAASPLTTTEWMALLVTAGWLLGVTLFGVLLLAGLWRTVKLRRTSLMVTEGVWPGLMSELRQRLGLSRSVELREHALSVVPLTWGIWRPVVLLPRLARAWDEPMQRAVLLHELAHVQRGDVACQVLGRLTCVLYWFHPLTWFALRQLRQEREQACDDAVVQSGEKASDYAEQLLEVARLCCAPRGMSLGVAMAEGSSLETRVKSLFDTARGHGPVSRRVAIASLLIGGAILAGLAPIEPTASQAETTANQTSPLNETSEADPTSALNGTNPKATKVEYPFSLDLCRKAFSDPACLQQLEQLNPVYGKATRGIQLGLAVNTLSRSFTEGERIPLMLVYRNVGQEALTFHISQDHWNDPPTVIDHNDKHVQVSFVMHFMFVPPLKITLKPGEAWCEMTPGLYLREPMPSIKSVAGKYRLTHPQGISDWQYEHRVETEGSAAGQIVNSPKWFEQLDTGTIEFEIAPSTNGALEARILASLPADDSGVVRTPTQEPAVPQKEPTPAGHNDQAPKVDDVNPQEKIIVLPDGNGDSKTIITGDVGITFYLDKIVWWGAAVDGLEPGFWLTQTEDPRNLRVPMDSLVKYHVVVRNTTDKEIEFLVRLVPFDGDDVPYLIPSSQLDTKGKIVAPQPAKEFQAQTQGAADRINRAYVITLAAGESALVPGEYGLYVGKTDDINTPSISDFVPGTHWIVQPLLVHPLTDKERAELNRLLGEFKVTKFDRDGKTRQEPVVRVVAPDNSKGDFAYAKYHLEVGTLDASADRNARSAIWGEVEQGMQCGIRIMNPQPSYKIGDTLEAELLWRNTSEADISTSRPRQLDLCPSIEDTEGRHLEIDFGARYDLLPGGHDFQPGEVRSLGVTKITLVAQGTPGPKDNKEPGHITLEPGKYKLSASGGVGKISPNSGKYEFTVAAPEASQPRVAVPNTISGQIVNDKQEGIAGADVALVAFEIVQGQLERQGHDIADPLGNYSLKLPADEVDTTKELSGDGDENIPIDPEAPISPVTLSAPTKRETTQPAPNIPQTRPNRRGAPTRAEPRPVVDMKRELLQRLVRGGKISSDSLNAMITLVSAEGAYDEDFISVILARFDESCEPKSTSSKRNLLAVLTKILEIHGSSRWQEPESGPDSIPQAVIPDTESLSRLTSEILEHLIDQGGKADRSDIDAFVVALRQARHADGKEFLRLVLQNPEVNAPSTRKPGLWADNMGGTWRDAKFHAAVALAELGEPEGVERLIEFARPNEFGLDESLFSLAHTRDANGSRRASSLFALIDLFGLEPDAGFAQMEAWWKVNQGQFHPKKVALGRAIQPRTAEQPQQ